MLTSIKKGSLSLVKNMAEKQVFVENDLDSRCLVIFYQPVRKKNNTDKDTQIR